MLIPVWIAHRQREDWERADRLAAWRVVELRATGFKVEMAWELVKTEVSYPEVLPTLWEPLGRPYPATLWA